MIAQQTVGDLKIDVKRLLYIAASAPQCEAIQVLLRPLHETGTARPTRAVLVGERMAGVTSTRSARRPAGRAVMQDRCTIGVVHAMDVFVELMQRLLG